VTVEWFVDGTATYDTNFAGRILVCADCGFTRHHMEKPREWATAAFAKPVRAAGSPYR
jgi:ribosomal protein L37E